MKLASCVIIPTGNTPEEILAISRRNDITKWGVPGGKQDAGESNVACAVREIREELGIGLTTEDLVPIYAGVCYGADGQDFWVTCYLLNDTVSGQIVDVEPGFTVRPMEITALTNHTASPFAPYNQHLVTAWRSFRTA